MSLDFSRAEWSSFLVTNSSRFGSAPLVAHTPRSHSITTSTRRAWTLKSGTSTKLTPLEGEASFSSSARLRGKGAEIDDKEERKGKSSCSARTPTTCCLRLTKLKWCVSPHEFLLTPPLSLLCSSHSSAISGTSPAPQDLIYLNGVCVDPRWQGCGIAKSVFSAGLAFMKRRLNGQRPLYLALRTQNPAILSMMRAAVDSSAPIHPVDTEAGFSASKYPTVTKCAKAVGLHFRWRNVDDIAESLICRKVYPLHLVPVFSGKLPKEVAELVETAKSSRDSGDGASGGEGRISSTSGGRSNDGHGNSSEKEGSANRASARARVREALTKRVAALIDSEQGDALLCVSPLALRG